MLTALIDYESGNLHSALKAFEKISSENSLGSVTITNDPEIISNADRLVLPGDGAFPACKAALEKSEVFEALKHAVLAKGRPFLGICVGMQLMAKKSFERKESEGLGFFNSEVKKILLKKKSFKIPHMGWNDIKLVNKYYKKPFNSMVSGDFYFVHSYEMICKNKLDILATVNYGKEIVAAVGKENILGVQFHPEKSQKKGQKFINDFLSWTP